MLKKSLNNTIFTCRKAVTSTEDCSDPTLRMTTPLADRINRLVSNEKRRLQSARRISDSVWYHWVALRDWLGVAAMGIITLNETSYRSNCAGGRAQVCIEINPRGLSRSVTSLPAKMTSCRGLPSGRCCQVWWCRYCGLVRERSIDECKCMMARFCMKQMKPRSVEKNDCRRSFLDCNRDFNEASSVVSRNLIRRFCRPNTVF